jgi:hypothetical protein
LFGDVSETLTWDWVQAGRLNRQGLVQAGGLNRRGSLRGLIGLVFNIYTIACWFDLLFLLFENFTTMSFLRYNKKPPYYIRQAGESFFRYICRVVESMIRMYPHAKVHGIRYMFDTDFRRAISTKRKKAIRVQREGSFGKKRVKARLKTQLIERDGERCLHCIKLLVREQLTIDHIFPLCMGGDNKLQNLQLLCVACHEEKTRNDHELYRIKEHCRLGYVPSSVTTSSSSSACKSDVFYFKIFGCRINFIWLTYPRRFKRSA